MEEKNIVAADELFMAKWCDDKRKRDEQQQPYLKPKRLNFLYTLWEKWNCALCGV